MGERTEAFLTVQVIKGKTLDLHWIDIKKASLIFRALNHNVRWLILKLLEEQTKLTVTEILIALRMEQSIVSANLAILRRAGVVKTTREGKYIHYQLNEQRIAEIEECTFNLNE